MAKVELRARLRIGPRRYIRGRAELVSRYILCQDGILKRTLREASST